MGEGNFVFGLIWMQIFLCASVVSAQDLEELFEPIGKPWFLQQQKLGEQEEEPLETDRDSFTPATTTVAAGRLIYESSYSFIENRNTANDNSFPEIITRYGITRRLELRLGWNYEVGGGGEVSNGDAGGPEEEPGSHRESQFLYGFKFATTEQRDWIPRSAVIVQATTPTSGQSSYTDLNVGYVVGWTLFNNWHLDSSVRYVPTEQGRDHFNQWMPSTVLKVPVTRRIEIHGEYFGIFTDGSSYNTNRQYLSPGIHYLLTPRCEVGVRVGWGLNQESANFFSNVGLGLMF